MMTRARLHWLLVVSGLALACGDSTGGGRDRADDAADAGELDAAALVDAVSGPDPGAAEDSDSDGIDAAEVDATEAGDTSGPDAGVIDGDGGSDTAPAQDCDKGQVVLGGDVSAFDRCKMVRWLAIEGCDGEATTVTLPDLEETAESVTLCLDAGDVVSLPALRRVVGLSLALRGPAELAVAALEVEGDLALEIDNFAVELTLSGVVRIEGALNLGGQSGAQTLRVPDLAAVGRISAVGTATDRLVLDALTVAGRIDAGGALFSWLDAPILAEVTGDLRIGGRDFAAMSAPKLAHVGGVYQHLAGPFDTHGGFPALQSVGGDLTLRPTPCLERDCEGFESLGQASFPYPLLAAVGGALEIAATRAATTLALPALVSAGGLRVTENQALTALSIPLLNAVPGNVDVSGNPLLPQCSIDATLSGAVVGGTVTLEGNREDCVCAGADPSIATCPER
ncbi:MAG: hypothetical protein R3F39_18460 [Myxococcota bacterium]